MSIVVDNVAKATEKLIKPRLRGWLHLGAAPFALIAGLVLIVLAPTISLRSASAIFMVSSTVLFAMSALLHRGNWKPKTEDILRRIDHANIFIIIAGTYTPLAVALFDFFDQVVLLSIVWTAALGGVFLSVFFPHAPRLLTTPLYIGMGWVAIFYLPHIYAGGGVIPLVLTIVGGIFYTIGGAMYAFKRPVLSLTYFGFHELFHVMTILGFACHTVAIYFAVLN